MIELKNLTKVYGTMNYNVIALSDINYKMDQGEVVVLLGKSGSGKSTLLNILGGFDRNYAGNYLLDGENMKEKTEREIDTIRKRRIGFVFQQYILLNNLTVVENVEVALKVIGVVNQGSRRRAALHALKLVGLRDHADKFPYQLSGGQKQRVAIARAFVKNPDIIIADEPTAALDSRTSKEVLDLLKDLCRTKLLIIATHNKSIVRDYGSRVIELKSGYTIKNELITDPTKVRVDELDLIIDREIYEDDQVIQKIIDIEQKVTQENRDTVLRDLGVDLENFTLNNQNEFSIDEELKLRMIKDRMRNSKLNTRIYRFLQTSDSFFGKREYANKAFFRNIGLHLFSSLIFAVFLLTIVFGLNFITETFGGFNEKAMFSRTMNNENTVLFAGSEFLMEEEEEEMYDSSFYSFVDNFTQTEIQNAKFLDTMLSDPYYRYQYEQEKISYVNNALQTQGITDVFNIYYNNSSIILRQTNEEVLFEELQYTYQNIVQNPEPYTYVTNFMDSELDEGAIYQYNYMFSEGNSELLLDHMLENSELPDDVNEVVIPVAYLFKYEILTPDMFRDEHGNILEIIPSEMISEKFFEFSEQERVIEIERSIITFEDNGNSYIESYETETTQFVVVGLINFDGDINPYLEMREDVYVANNASTNFSFIFSKKAADYVTFTVVDNATYGDFYKSIQYAEITNQNFIEYDVQSILDDFEESYVGGIKGDIQTQFEEWIDTLNDATTLVADYVHSEMNGSIPDGSFLDDLVNDEMFEGLTYEDILYRYMAQHLLVIGNDVEYNYLSNVPMGSRTYDSLLDEAPQAYLLARNSDEYKDVLEVFGDVTRLTYQETTNRIIYEEYAHLFNNQFYETFNGEDYDLRLVSSFERESGSILNLVYLVVPRTLLEIIPFTQRIIESLEDLEQNERFISFLENTNLDLLISSISTNAIRSLVMVVLYVVVYVVLFVSIVFLSFVLINLYGNIYETATRKRVKELASLRVLGTSYDDIYDMLKIENRRVALFSYALFFGILYLLGNLGLFTDAPITHFYMPLLGLFFDFNLYDVFLLNPVAVIFVTIIFYFFIYRFIIKRVSTKKISNIDTIQAIRDGDNL